MFILLQKTKNVAVHTLYEWINPITDEAGGAYPFRTDISTISSTRKYTKSRSKYQKWR
jgi:hypothetical protein